MKVTWYDGDQRPPVESQNLIKPAKFNPERGWMPDQGSILIGTKGVMSIPHIDRPKLFPETQYAGFERPKLEPSNHWHQFVDGILGKGKPWANFDYAGPLTEAVLLGCVATRFPKTTLEWDAKKLKFTNEKAANQFVRREYRKGWEVKGLS